MTTVKRIEWTEELRISLYREVINTLGHPMDVARDSRGKPVGMDKAEYILKLEDIGIAIGVGANKGGALSNQIAWVTCVPTEGCHQGHWNNYNKNVLASTKAGYLIKPTVRMTTEPADTNESYISSAWKSVKEGFKSLFQ